MVEKGDYESEWEEKFRIVSKKSEELIPLIIQLQEVGQKRLDYLKKESEEIRAEMPKKKAIAKTIKMEEDLYKISDQAVEFSRSCNLVDRDFKDMKERIKGYESKKTGRKKKEEYHE